MDQMRDEYPLAYMCHVFDIHRQAFYKWEKKGKPIANNFNIEDAKLISEEHYRLERKYGVERLTQEIRQHLGVVFNHKKVRRYLRLLGLSCVARVRKPKTNKKDEKKGHHLQMAPNLLDNNFTSERPHHKISTDVSYIACTDGWLHLSAVKDLFNKQIISYSMSNRNDVDLVIKSIQRIPKGNGIIHSDQGSLYFDNKYIKYIKKLGYKRSMSRKGACWENSPIENWFSQIKEERLRIDGLMSKKQTKKAIKKYVRWYNNERIQKALNYLSPIKYSLCF